MQRYPKVSGLSSLLRVMRVLQVNKLYSATGGVESIVRSMARGFAALGHDSHVLASVKRGQGSEYRDNNVSVTTVGSAGMVKSTPIAPTFPIRLRKAASESDIVHHHLPNPLGPVSHLMGVRNGPPTVCTYHSDIVRQTKLFQIYRPVLEKFLDDVDRIVTTSPRLLERSSVLSPFKSKSDVVPLGIDLQSINRSATYGDDLPNGPIILFVGRLVYYKGVEYLIDAVELLDGHLLIVGEGPQRQELEHQVKERGLCNQVTFLGFVSESDLDGLYQAAQIFVLPSVEPSEAFGIVQLEAMAHGLPVVNTNLPTGVPWVSQDGKTGITVPPRNTKALAAALEELLQDDERRDVLGSTARKRVEKMFTREQMLNKIEKIYEEEHL